MHSMKKRISIPATQELQKGRYQLPCKTMNLQPTSDKRSDYLQEIPSIIEFQLPMVRQTIHEIEATAVKPAEKVKLAFEIARDRIRHSFDTRYSPITISAEEALFQQEWICFAKSHVLAALLRGMNIPTGFCYQRVLRKGTPDSGYALHGLNAVYLPEFGWFRLDPRGNKPGVDAQFSTDKEKLAYPIRPELGEVDYPQIFPEPLPAVIQSMRTAENCESLFYERPESL